MYKITAQWFSAIFTGEGMGGGGGGGGGGVKSLKCKSLPQKGVLLKKKTDQPCSISTHLNRNIKEA